MKYALGLGHQAVRKHERLWVKRGIAALAVVLLLTGGILPLNVMSEAVFADVGDVNVVPDPQLQACINVTKLSRPADTPITPAELASLTASLVATSYPGITSFEGLQYATHINSMTFNDVSINDLTPLGQMTSLKSLNIQTHTTPNGVVDLTPLAPLAAQFTSLTLNGSYYYPVQTTQIIGLSVLPNLTTLSVNANCLTALPGLSSLTHLKSLYLTSNDFGNDIIAQLPNVSYSILNLSSNHISDFTGVPAAGNRILGGQTVVGTDVLLASADQDSLTADPADRPA
ncbi:MAG: hypothetical protein FWC59_03080, partial [Actinomycetia bacterium]|nr:hypothetical protein [Actinomycetes bacterium]